ncbi:MAG: hypothetical protein ACLVJ6_03040 [Merdibacter sp.]
MIGSCIAGAFAGLMHVYIYALPVLPASLHCHASYHRKATT